MRQSEKKRVNLKKNYQRSRLYQHLDHERCCSQSHVPEELSLIQIFAEVVCLTPHQGLHYKYKLHRYPHMEMQLQYLKNIDIIISIHAFL